MKRMALFVIAALVFSVFAPRAQAQPFADVPTDIFAFDAVAELAAKGIIEGYPDGTFKGDRAMTRYEMAMVVARLLARIEAIKIPPAAAAPAAQVTKADVDRLQRLLNEFRAELAAQGVRVTAVEEELAAIRAKLSNVRITGDLRFRYTVSGTLPTPLGPDGRVTNAANSDAVAAYRNRLTFTGQAANNVRAVVQVVAAGGAPGSSQFTFNSAPLVNGVAIGLAGFGNAYIDFDPLWGMAWRLGRQVYTLAPVGLSNYGLLFDPGDSGFGYADGLRVKGTFSGFNWEIGAWAGGAGAAGAYNLGNIPAGGPVQFVNTFYTGMLTIPLLPGWPIRVSALSQQRNWNSGGLNPNTSDFGWAVDASGNLIPGVGFGAAYANFSGYLAAAGATQSSNAWTAWLNFDLGALSGMTTFSPKLGFQYKNYGPNSGDFNAGTATMPAINGAITETFGDNYWNFQGWAATLGLKFTPDLSGTFTYESGTTLVNGTGYGSGAGVVPSGSQVTEWYATFDYALATATTLSARYFRRTVANSDSSNFYRIQLTYSY